MFIKKKKMEKDEAVKEPRWPRVDLNDHRQRNAFLIFAVGTTIFLFLSAIGSYEAYHFTESVEFCGKVCHNVMKPEFTAYQQSPHSRVACVECHVGSGANWYVKSKLSGLHQVYAVLADNYPTPIPTPIDNLRPARETCEQCHWPAKFYARTLRTNKHFMADADNTEWDINLAMKIGGEHMADALAEGSHWHINQDVKIEYIARDDQRQEIPWVKYTNLKTGKSYIFENEDDPLDKMEKDSLETRTMDCIDCHSRPSHNYKPPAFFVNYALADSSMPSNLPDIKMLSMEICGNEFGTTDSAMTYIENEINSYYADNYPEIADTNSALIQHAITGLQEQFKQNIFPEMKARWSAYPNNIGHLEFNGCFRCHDNLHASEEGNYIKKDCNQCHYIVGQGTPGQMELASIDSALEFKHPVDIGESWKDFLCTDCHTGLNP